MTRKQVSWPSLMGPDVLSLVHVNGGGGYAARHRWWT